MILKGSQRGHGSDLATHLSNEFDNEGIEFMEVRGTVADDLHGFMVEIEAIAAGTKCTQPFFALSINPSEAMSREEYARAVDAIEDKLGLSGQPRAIVMHEKMDADGITREHAHVVWSRIDASSMRAVPMSFFKAKLCDMACKLAREFGHDLPPGLEAWEKGQRLDKDKLEDTLADKAALERTAMSAEERARIVTDAYDFSDSPAAFRAALEEHGLLLAKGDRRAFVIVDSAGQVHSLSRHVKGVKSKEIARKLEGLDVSALPSVEQAKAEVKARLDARAERLREKAREQADEVQNELRRYESQLREKLRRLHETRREKLAAETRAMKARQGEEKMLLIAAHMEQQARFSFKVRRGVMGLIERVPGLRSVLGPLQKLGLDPKVQQAREKDALAARHEREAREIARKERALEKIEARERQSLERKVKRKRRLSEGDALAAVMTNEQRQAQELSNEPQEVKRTDYDLMIGGGLTEVFDRKSFEGTAGGETGDGDGDEGYSWKTRSKDYRRSRGRSLNLRDDDHDDGDDPDDDVGGGGGPGSSGPDPFGGPGR
jgi:hypothetical protein